MSDCPDCRIKEAKANAYGAEMEKYADQVATLHRDLDVQRERSRHLESALAGLADCINTELRENGPHDDQISGIDVDMRPFVRRLVDRVNARASKQPHTDVHSERDSFARIIQRVREATLFEDGVSADLHSAGIVTLADAYRAGREDGINEVGEALNELPANQAPADCGSVEANARDHYGWMPLEAERPYVALRELFAEQPTEGHRERHG